MGNPAGPRRRATYDDAMSGSGGDDRLTRWERRTGTPLLVLAVLFAAAYAVPILRPDAREAVHRTATAVEWVVWAAFAADYLTRLALSGDRWRFVRRNPLALLTVALPLLQPLRLLRVVSALMLVGQRVRIAAQVRLTVYVLGTVLALLFFGALGVLEAERGSPDGNIHSLGDALWWAFTTMTTVGYGDLAPTTGRGRLLAVGLMLSGIALLGVVTANIAAWFITRFEQEEAESRRGQRTVEELVAEVQELRTQLTRLNQVLAEPPVRAGGGDTPVPSPASDR
ncbi:potassium channel family protein [Streptomyces capparidis]